MLLDFETISSCWTWYSTDFLYFQPDRTMRAATYQTLKQYQVAGLGMVLISLFFYCHQIIRVALLFEFETISSCWTWYSTDISFPFLSPNYQSRRVIRF